ncbi:MAG: hypothetical protein HKM04_12035 [Legionellales bacterium]|nr:hypothetical protein [Legionellales bacterium]
MKIQDTIKLLVDSLNTMGFPDKKEDMKEHIEQLTLPKVKKWHGDILKFSDLLTSFSKTIIDNTKQSKKDAGEDWFINQREKNIFIYFITHDSNIAKKLNDFLEFLYEIQNRFETAELANIGLSASFGQQMTSMCVACEFAQGQKELVVKYFHQLVATTNENKLSYAQVMAFAIARLFSHVNDNIQLTRKPKVTGLNSVLSQVFSSDVVLPQVVNSDSAIEELKKLVQIWAFTSEKGGVALSNLKRSFMLFYDQIESNIQKNKLPTDDENVLDTALNDIRVSMGLFLLAAADWKIEKCAKQGKDLIDKKIRYNQVFLTKNYQQDVLAKANSLPFDKQALIDLTKKMREKKRKEVRVQPSDIVVVKEEEHLSESFVEKPADSNSEQVNEKIPSNMAIPHIVATELTPNKKNIHIFFQNGTEQKFPIANASQDFSQKPNDNLSETNRNSEITKTNDKKRKAQDFDEFFGGEGSAESTDYSNKDSGSNNHHLFKKVKVSSSSDDEMSSENNQNDKQSTAVSGNSVTYN